MDLSPPDWEYVEERAGAFVGRGWVFARLRSFLSGPPGIFLLRGDPGTGKTAVAGRLAQASCGRTTTGSLETQMAVAEGTISAAVFCRAGKATVAELVQRLSRQLANSVEGFSDTLQSALAPEVRIGDVYVQARNVVGDVAGVVLNPRRDEWSFNVGVAMPLRNVREQGVAQPIVLLVDAVDEAAAGSEINVFSRLLARLEGVHLIVTCRSDARVLADFRAAGHQVDLVGDAPPGDQDVRVFIGNRLQGLGAEAAMGVLGDRIASEAAGNFLYAFYVTGDFARSARLAEMDERAARRLPLPVGGLPGVYEEFLDRQIGGDETRWARVLRPVLAPVCVAFGDGFTTAQIGAVASRLGDRDFSLSDVRDVTRAAGQFLGGRRPDGPFRFYHPSFARFLTDPSQNPNWPIDRADTHTAVLRALRAEGGDRGWLASSAYARRYAQDHAAAVGLLDELLEDPPYLAAADPDRLLRVLPAASTRHARKAERLLQRVGARLPGRPGEERTVEERAAILELGARQLGARWIADQLAKLPPGRRPWSPRWVHRLPVGNDRIVGWHEGPVRAVAVGEREESAVVVSGGSDGMVCVWDLRTGGALTEWPHGEGGVEAIAIGELPEGPVVVSGGKDGKLRRWNLTDGSRYGEPLGIVGAGKVTSAAVGDLPGGPFIVAAYGSLDTIRLWDLGSGQPLGELGWGPDFPLGERIDVHVEAIAAGTCDGRPVIVAGHSEGAHKWVWTGDEWAAEWLISGSGNTIWAVALGMVDGRPVAVCGGDWLLTTLDLASGERALPSYESPDGLVIGVAIGDVDGRAVAVSGKFFGTDPGILRVWDLANEEKPLWGSLAGHYGGSKALAITQLDGRPVLVSGGFDHTVRAWDLKDRPGQMTDPVEHQTIDWLQACELGGRPAVVSKGSTRLSFSKNWVWHKKVDEDLDEFRKSGNRSRDRSFLIGKGSIVEREEADTSSKRVIRVWDQADGMPADAHSLDLDHVGDLCATGGVGDAALGVSVDDPIRPERFGVREKNTHLRVRDLRTGAQMGQPIPINDRASGTIAIGGLGDRPVVVFADDFSGDDDFPGDDDRWEDVRVQAWDVRAARLVWEPLPAYHGRGPHIRAFGTLAGQPIAAIAALNHFGIWDLQRGELIAEPPSMQGENWLFPPAAIGELAGRPVVVYSGYGRPIRVWDMTTGHECQRAIEVDTEIQALTIAPDSTIIASGPGGALALRMEPSFSSQRQRLANGDPKR